MQSPITNNLTLIGRLGKDPVLTKFDKGGEKVTFSIATDESYWDKENKVKVEVTEWHNIETNSSKLIPFLTQYVKSGDMVAAIGSLRHRRDEPNKRTFSFMKLRAVKILAKNAKTAAPGSQPSAAPSASTNQYVPMEAAEGNDDLPF